MINNLRSVSKFFDKAIKIIRNCQRSTRVFTLCSLFQSTKFFLQHKKCGLIKPIFRKKGILCLFFYKWQSVKSRTMIIHNYRYVATHLGWFLTFCPLFYSCRKTSLPNRVPSCTKYSIKNIYLTHSGYIETMAIQDVTM